MRHPGLYSGTKSAEQSARYRDVSKIIEAAKAVDWSKLNKPDKEITEEING